MAEKFRSACWLGLSTRQKAISLDRFSLQSASASLRCTSPRAIPKLVFEAKKPQLVYMGDGMGCVTISLVEAVFGAARLP
jgi:hypothetical protein